MGSQDCRVNKGPSSTHSPPNSMVKHLKMLVHFIRAQAAGRETLREGGFNSSGRVVVAQVTISFIYFIPQICFTSMTRLPTLGSVLSDTGHQDLPSGSSQTCGENGAVIKQGQHRVVRAGMREAEAEWLGLGWELWGPTEGRQYPGGRGFVSKNPEGCRRVC